MRLKDFVVDTIGVENAVRMFFREVVDHYEIDTINLALDEEGEQVFIQLKGESVEDFYEDFERYLNEMGDM